MPSSAPAVTGFFQMTNASSDWAHALAVPETLCVSGEVYLICIIVTMPMAKPSPPAAHMSTQNAGENSRCWKRLMVSISPKTTMHGTNITAALTLLTNVRRHMSSLTKGIARLVKIELRLTKSDESTPKTVPIKEKLTSPSVPTTKPITTTARAPTARGDVDVPKNT
eukprot:Amastigsp_a843169_40.p4 type:complete len:167 gc:universal Amastigsp_a843169_40:255-755(+)